MNNQFYELIQVALGTRNGLSRKPSDDEWLVLFETCEKQAISGFVFPALDKLSEQGQKPPTDLLFEWIGLSEQLKGQNAMMNAEAARLSKMFENEGHRTAILKGQANSLLYPDPLSRQPGDIDIWVSGGKEMVIRTLRKLDFLKSDLSKNHLVQAAQKYHHIHLSPYENGIDVEVHFRPSSGNYDLLTNQRLQAFLEDEIDKDNKLMEYGFRVPSLTFALIMQLAHIQRHFISEGVGMRQVIDYYYLLKKYFTDRVKGHSDGTEPTVDSRRGSQITEKLLKNLGLEKMAGALMWVLHEKLGLEEKYLIAPMDEKRGQMLLEVMMEGGNFGHYSHFIQDGFSITGSLKYRLKKYKLLKFNARETIWGEVDYATLFVMSIPERIRRRSWTLR